MVVKGLDDEDDAGDKDEGKFGIHFFHACNNYLLEILCGCERSKG